MKLLITGAGGFVGRHLLEAALRRGAECVGVVHRGDSSGMESADLRDPSAIDALLTRTQPSVIVHAASSPHWRPGGDPAVAAVEERAMASSLLDAAATLNSVPLLVMLGSASEYGDLGSEPIREDADPHPTSAYGKAKASLAKALIRRADEARVPLTWARVFNLLGPDQPVSAPVANWAQQVAVADDGDEIVVGDLDPIRDFLDVRDAADMLIDLATLPRGGVGVVNVCSGQGTELREILRQMIQLIGRKLRVREKAGLTNRGPSAVIGDPAMLHELIDECSLIPLNQSLEEILAKYR